MSIYKSGVDAYRDTTKWLVAFIPVTAITTTAVLLAAPLRAGALAASDPSTWMARHGSIVWCAIVVIAAIGAILWCAARVLSAAPIEVASILERVGGAKKEIDAALGSGIAAPAFLSTAEFDTATVKLRDPNQSPSPPELDRLGDAFETLREWTMFTETKRRFNLLAIAMGLGIPAICIAVLVALSHVGSAAAITEPVAVDVQLSRSGADALTASTGCQDPPTTTFLAVAGTWDAPVLLPSGTGCEFGVRWTPAPDQVIASLKK